MQNRLSKTAILIASWTFLAFLFTPQTFLLNSRSYSPLTWWESLAANMVLFYLWALLTPLVWLLGKKYPLEKKKFKRNFLVLLFFSFPVAFLHILLLQQGNIIFLQWSKNLTNQIPLSSLLTGMGASNVMIFWAIITVCQSHTYFQRYHDREESLVQAQLQSLKTQLQPHFLFNTLNAISQLVYEDGEEAEKMISRLSDLLRLSLKSVQTQEIVLTDELEFLKRYLEIQQTLLQDRLKVIWRIMPETYDAVVPNMLLQPLAENSIRHGIAPRIEGGTIKIVTTREENWLTLRICDDGLGLDSQSKKRTKQFGIGLQNTQKRLKHLYGEDHSFQLKSGENGRGALVFIKIPFKPGKKERTYENPYSDNRRYNVGTKTPPALSEQRLRT